MRRHFATVYTRIMGFEPKCPETNCNTKSEQILNIIMKYSLFIS